MNKKATISDQLREAITRAAVTRYRISMETGVQQAVLSRFVKGRTGLDLSTVDKLADYLGLELAPVEGKKQVKKG